VFLSPHHCAGHRSQRTNSSTGKSASSTVSQLSIKRKITNSEFISNFNNHNKVLKLSLTMNIEDYGYDDAAPDVESMERNDFDYYYSYGDASPDISREKFNYYDRVTSKRASREKVRDYAYGDAAPTVASRDRNKNGNDSSRRTPRRSSMKQGGAPRRSSIGYSGEITVTLPGDNRPVRRRTSISFDQKEHVKEVEPVSSLTEDPKKLWFQADEFNQIREKARMLTYIAVNGGDGMVKEKKLCTRGLESHIDSKNVQEEQSLAWKSVFLEQSHQREKGTCDDETVSKMYQLASMESQARARTRACQDEANIVRYTRHTRRTIRRGSM
jgi:hypothetical protein